ncbi:hypothetical protein, partial [Streptomyces millisiae]
MNNDYLQSNLDNILKQANDLQNSIDSMTEMMSIQTDLAAVSQRMADKMKTTSGDMSDVRDHLADFDDPDENCSLIHGAPMSHGSGLYIPPYVLRGARQVIPESAAFDPDEFLDLCGHHPGSSAFLAPTMVQRLIQTGRPRPE